MDKEIDVKRLEGKRNYGLCFLIIGVVLIVWFSYASSRNWYYGLGALGGLVTIGLGIILVVIGFILLIVYYSQDREKTPSKPSRFKQVKPLS